ncbi:MAG TPA: hypothetical protein VMF66_07245 [Candidatus Acidoferrum sp.]|nr:hypothetical protein [Candidatus Acidoferrum sp.]
MRTQRKLTVLAVACMIAVGGVALRAMALSYPLTSTSIRNAYFIGNRNDEQTADFLAKYVHPLPMPETGPYVEDIGIETPFSEVVQLTKTKANFYAPDAVQEFQHRRFTFRVFVDIALTDTYQPIGPTEAPQDWQWVPDFWNDFKVKLVQDNKEIPADQVRGGPVYPLGYEDVPLVQGAHIEVLYDPAKLHSALAQIVVLAPTGQSFESTFNLGELR